MTRNIVGLICGRVTWRNRCQVVAPSTMAASSSTTGTFCNAARNISMNVPEVVQTTSVMIDTMATLGPDSQSHQLRPPTPCPASAVGASSTPNQPRTMCSTPRESENHDGPLIPNSDSKPLTTPELAKMNRNTTLIAT